MVRANKVFSVIVRPFAYHPILIVLLCKACMMPFTIQLQLLHYCHFYIVNFVPNIIHFTWYLLHARPYHMIWFYLRTTLISRYHTRSHTNGISICHRSMLIVIKWTTYNYKPSCLMQSEQYFHLNPSYLYKHTHLPFTTLKLRHDVEQTIPPLKHYNPIILIAMDLSLWVKILKNVLCL